MSRIARVSSLLLVGLAVVALVGPAATSVVAVNDLAPKVVLIVGPAGGATPYYRRLADEAAAAAVKLTPNVVKVYSPDATWANVKAAMQGASVVVYLGHGNGWPSVYSDALHPTSQDGFGLNPHAGAADSHQYFGEEQIGSQVKLAPDAVVIFSHLCYASGNTEPGLAEGTLGQGQQRVDNYAAGFFKAGARAVIADSYLAPRYYLTAVLRGRQSIDAIWKGAPNRNDHFLQFASVRTKDAIAQMDPDNLSSGFHRSIVMKASLTSHQVIGNAIPGANEPTPVVEPSLVSLGVTFGSPDLIDPPTAGTKTTLVLPIARDVVALLPAALMVGTRWDLLDGGTSAPSPVAASAPSGVPAAPAPAGGRDPGTTAAADPTTDLVVPEQQGELVAPVPARRLASGGVAVAVTVPTNPGLYRLVSTVNQPDGTAYDAATQALIPALIVRVTAAQSATYGVPAAATSAAGATFDLGVRVANLGRTPWGSPSTSQSVSNPERDPARHATLVVRWVDLGGVASGISTPAGAVASSILPPGMAPGSSVAVNLPVVAPPIPGEYLLVLDVVDPVTGSLAAAGVPPGIVRVTVTG